ncbi:MAG: hypothetical protein JXR77_01835, partial [Lentisphaeria bacterium]|nr:hypothetical protein [Lentisphaeria bacterium]
MRQIIVGGDNEDAYHICDAFLEHAKGTGVPVLFCTTPQEVLTNLSRGGADVVVLSFESAGLTNYELAHRIRDMGEEGNVPLLLSEVDALGDVKAVLGPRVDVFAYPANPGNVLARAKPFLDQAAEEHKAVAARAKKPDPPKPTIAGDRV